MLSSLASFPLSLRRRQAGLAQASVTSEGPALILRDLLGCGQLRMGRACASVLSGS